MDEFNLYCALEEKIKMEFDYKAIHLRGPETISRQFPEMCKEVDFKTLGDIQNKISYIDVYYVACVFYIVGLWNKIDNFFQIKKCNKKDLEISLKMAANG